MINIDINYFKAVQGAKDAKYDKQVKVRDTQQRFNDEFSSSFNYEPEATRNDIPQEFIISPSHAKKNEGSVFARPNEELYMGDVLYWRNAHWLVTEINLDDLVSRSGNIELCNRTICWQNPVTKEIHERWCIAEKPYTSNIDKGNEVNTSNREYKIRIPFDEETALIDLDKRFLLEKINGQPKAYKVTCVDTITNKYEDEPGGFLVWNLTQSEYNKSTDNAELMIADYESSESPVYGDLEITFIGNPEIRAGGLAKTFTAESDEPVDWEVVVMPETEKYISTIIKDNQIEVSAQRSSDIIGSSIKLVATNSTQSSEITIKILGGM